MYDKNYNFNHKVFQNNTKYINDPMLTDIGKKNLKYLNIKNNIPFSYNNNLAYNNNIISTEQSTILSNDNLFINKSGVNNIQLCNCFCHKKDKQIMTNTLDLSKQSCKCMCHNQNNLMISCPDYGHVRCNHQNNLYPDVNYHNRLSRSADNIENRNGNLVYIFNGLNKKYNRIKEVLEYMELDEKQRNNYIKQLEDQLSLNNNYKLNNYPKENRRYRNRSNDDAKINYDDYINNYINESLLEKTRMVLYSSFSGINNYKYRNNLNNINNSSYISSNSINEKYYKNINDDYNNATTYYYKKNFKRKSKSDYNIIDTINDYNYRYNKYYNYSHDENTKTNKTYFFR